MEWVKLRQRTLPALGIIFLFLLVWYLIAHSGWFIPSLLPSPIDVLYAISELWMSGSLIQHIGASVLRVLVGFLLATVLGVPLGIALGWYKGAHHAFEPLIKLLHTISPIAWVPLAILWFGIGNTPAVFIIFITSFFPILIASMHAVKNVDPLLVKAALNFGADGKILLMKVIFPAALPYIIIGLRLALGIAWVIIVAAEMVGMRSGLGFMILDARNFLRTDLVIAGMVIIGIIGLILDRIMGWIEMKLERHKREEAFLG